MFKKFLLLTSSGLLKITLFSLALAGAGWMTFSTPDKIKQAAEENKLYDSALTNVLETAKKDIQNEDAQLPINQPEIEQAAKNAFPSDLLSKNSASIIDGIYAWLQGKTEQPEFSVDLGEAKQSFANGVADYAQKRYESLPVCTFEQLRTLNTDVEPFDVQCQVPGITGAGVREKVLNEITASDEFLKDTSFSAQDLPKDEQGRTVTENLSGAPDVYSILKMLPWLLGILAVSFAAGVLFFSESKRRGLKSISITLLGTGIFLFLGSWLITWSFKQMNAQSNDAFQKSLIGAAKSLSDDYNAALLKYALVYVVIGGGIMLTLWYQNRNNKNTSEDSSEPNTPQTPAEQLSDTKTIEK